MFDKREFCTHAQLYQERNRTPRQYPPKMRCMHEASLELNCTRLLHPVQSPGVQSYLQSRTKLLEKVLPIMSTFLGNKTISKTTPLRKENPFPQFNVASYKRPGIRLSFEYTTTLLPGEGGERRIGTATMFRKRLSNFLNRFVQDCGFRSRWFICEGARAGPMSLSSASKTQLDGPE